MVRFGSRILRLYLAYIVNEFIVDDCVKGKKKCSMVMGHALVNFSLSPDLEPVAGVGGFRDEVG